MDSETINAQLPLTEATFFILLSLAPGSKHGYAIMQDVEDLSRGRVTLSTGTLYGALKRMLEQDWIRRVENSLESERGRPRKDYHLTETGRRILQAEMSRLETLTRTARLRLQEDSA